MTQIFTVQRLAETDQSTSGDLLDPTGVAMCKILERGLKNFAYPRITAGLYTLARKPLGSSRFDAAFRELIGKTYKGVLWLSDVPGRTNIEIHTANLIQQLEGCLATGEDIGRDDANNFMVAPGTSKPAYAHIYPILAAAIDNGGAQLQVKDIGG